MSQVTPGEYQAQQDTARQAEWAAEDAASREAAKQGGILYELKIIASGEVRDADGNLLNTPTAESTVIVTEAEALAIMERQAQQ